MDSNEARFIVISKAMEKMLAEIRSLEERVASLEAMHEAPHAPRCKCGDCPLGFEDHPQRPE